MVAAGLVFARAVFCVDNVGSSLSFANFRIVCIIPLDSMLQLFIWNIPKNNILKFGA